MLKEQRAWSRSFVWMPGLIAVLVAFPVLDAFGLTLLYLSDVELVKRSDLIIRGRVHSKRAQWNEKRTAIFTRVKLQVQEELLKRRAPAWLEVSHYGGRVGTVTSLVPGRLHFRVGEEVIVFVHRSKVYRDEYLLTGWTQGKWQLSTPPSTAKVSSGEKLVTRAMPTTQMVAWARHQGTAARLKRIMVPRPPTRTLHNFRTYLRTLHQSIKPQEQRQRHQPRTQTKSVQPIISPRLRQSKAPLNSSPAAQPKGRTTP